MNFKDLNSLLELFPILKFNKKFITALFDSVGLELNDKEVEALRSSEMLLGDHNSYKYIEDYIVETDKEDK